MRQESLSFPYSERQIREMYNGSDGLKKKFLREARKSNGLPTPGLLNAGEKMIDLLTLENTPDCIQLEVRDLTNNRIKE